MIEDLKQRLNQYYQNNGICPEDFPFPCKYYTSCKGACETFTEARMPQVGEQYGQSIFPRLLVISLDPPVGESSRLISIGTSTDDVYKWKKHKHWYLTHELIWNILKRFEPNIDLRDVPAYFAHTNSAKCSMNKMGGKQADKILFKNCREYIPGEVAIFDPDIIITQGNYAWDSIRNAFTPDLDGQGLSCGKDSHKCWYSILKLPSGGQTLWLHTYHPNQRRGLYHVQKSHYSSCYPEIALSFIKNKQLTDW